MRSACAGEASVLVEMNASELTFTIRDLAEVDGPGRVVLCDVHLDRMRAPRGWALVDERSDASLLTFPDRHEAQPAGGGRSEGSVTQLRPGGAGRPDAVRRVEEAVHPLDLARPGRPSVSEPAEMPLLARAFLGVDRHPSRSEPADPDDTLVDAFPADDADWDQRDHRDEHEDEQLPLGSYEPEPIA